MLGKRSGSERRLSNGSDYKGIERRVGGERRSGAERREHPRFLAKIPTFVTLWSEYDSNYTENMGQLLDISRAGLALRCTANPEEPNNYSLLEILLSGYNFNIDEIPFKVISTIEMTTDSNLSELTLRRYGVQFGRLTTDQ